MTADFWLGVAVGTVGTLTLVAAAIAIVLYLTSAPYNQGD